MKNFLLLAGALIAFQVQAQSRREKDLLLNDKVTVKYPDHVVTARVKPAAEAPAPDPLKVYSWYSANSIRSTRGGFSGKVLHGSYNEFSGDGNLLTSGRFRNGLREGEWRRWGDKGALLERINWRYGQQDGTFYRYDNSGKLAEKASYRKDLLHGKRTLYQGDSTQVTWYREGKVYQHSNKLARLFRKINPFGKRR